MSNKLIVCIMGQDCERFISMCLESIKDSDVIVYLDGGSTDKTLEIIRNYKDKHNNNFSIISNEYSQEDRGMNGKQRNIYLRYVKEKYPNDWCLVLDADEVVEDLNKIKEVIQFANKGVYSVNMRHFIGDLGHEDSTVPKHYVPNRLFKISEAYGYQELEHPVLQGVKNTFYGQINETTIFHLAYIPNLWELKKRYDNHMKKSNMHTPEYLKNWYYSHIFGSYPRTPINLTDIPEVILKTFGIDKDEFYFQERLLENKHWIDALDWKEYFKAPIVVEFGCGLGPRIFAMNNVGQSAIGIELSKWAKNHRMHANIEQGDITNNDHPFLDTYKHQIGLTIAYDVLEHVDKEKLPAAIDTLIKYSNKYILVSVPTLGDPNLENDKTHKIRETKEWWVKKFTDKGVKLVKTPEHFLFREQVMIFEK